MVLTCVARLFPRLSSVVLLCGNRVTPAIFAERMAALAITSIKVEVCSLGFDGGDGVAAALCTPLCCAPCAWGPCQRLCPAHKHSCIPHCSSSPTHPPPPNAHTNNIQQELELRFLYLTNPRLGAWLEDLSGIAGLRHLMVLRLAGGATPPPPFFEGLTALRRLRTLELLPGVYGQIAGFDMDVVQPGAGVFVC